VLYRLAAMRAVALGALLVLGGAALPGGATHAAELASPPLCLGKRATIVGTATANVLRGTPRTDVIAALGGNDVVTGGGGNDLVCGGAGADTLEGGAGADRLDGGPGRDACRGGETLRGCEETRPHPAPGVLAPGAYVTRVFSPAFGFRVGSGWSLRGPEDETQVLLVTRPEPGGLAVTVDSFARRQSVAETISRFASIPQTVPTAAAAAVTVAGKAGQRIDLTVDGSATGLVRVPGLTDQYELEPTDRLRVYAIGVGSGTVTILVEAPVAEFASFLPVAEELLASVQFVP
jgi:Ca2+-binding RTX toxin-like protein